MSNFFYLFSSCQSQPKFLNKFITAYIPVFILIRYYNYMVKIINNNMISECILIIIIIKLKIIKNYANNNNINILCLPLVQNHSGTMHDPACDVGI